MAMKTVYAQIEGRVQGVFFRDYTRRQAETLGLNGWVKNMPKGTVEAVFCGKEKDINAMITWLHTGSPHSNVTKVTISDHESLQNFDGFQIIF